jgi:superfamily II DNA or RNA helicase
MSSNFLTIFSKLIKNLILQPIFSNFFMQLFLNSRLKILKSEITANVWKWIQKELTLKNHQFLLLKKLGKSTWKIPPEIILYEFDEEFYYLPRGFCGDLIRYLQKEKVIYQLIDQRVNEKFSEPFENHITLRNYQKEAVDSIISYHFGVVVAPPGSGKTVMGLDILAKQNQRTLILVHRKELLDQWVERIVSFLNIEKKDVGIFGGGKKKWGERITVSTIQTLSSMKESELKKYSEYFGLILVDECHHIPAQTFKKVITNFNPYYCYGLTATPQRKNKDEKQIFLYIGNIISVIDPQADLALEDRKKPTVIIKETQLFIPFEYSKHNFELLSKVVVCDAKRNQQIVSDALEEARKGKKVLILTERKDHVEILNMYLESLSVIICVTGDDSKTLRQSKLTKVRKGDFNILIATGQLMGEGVDISNLDCLILAYPFSFEGKLIQYIGRIQRSTTEQIIYDYRDIHTDFLEKLYQKRAKYYITI